MTFSTHQVSTSMAGFKWMDLLEKEFDKSFVSMDELFKSVTEEYEIYDLYEANRKVLANMGSCFVQVLHKAQTIIQQNAKHEAELIHLREELAESKATLAKVESEKKYLVCKLQSSLMENQKLKAPNMSKDRDASGEEKMCADIQLKLANEMAIIQRVDWNAKKMEERAKNLEEENIRLRKSQVELESELVGARLDSRYLDKELAGRIQQIQILLANGTSQEHKQKVWNQIETEMHLQRSKTISNMCYAKQRIKDSSRAHDPHENDRKESFTDPKSRIKQVHIHKNDSEELGMAILGGKEHGLPIMISEVFSHTAVGRCQKISAGDVILAVNGDSFQELGHHEAVKYLSALRGAIKLDLEHRVDDNIEDVCDMTSRYYEIFGDVQDSNVDYPAVPRMSLSRPGQAKDTRPRSASIDSRASTNSVRELPQVHSSPKKSALNGKVSSI
ncbi:Golgi-associated PDZ and coiled-coil motif-containing protein-like [Tigriopus californicus]|nr:Golgi-associated PDZ and coiled-coil motif-containing protein-like [Tigriopus californicus]